LHFEKSLITFTYTTWRNQHTQSLGTFHMNDPLKNSESYETDNILLKKIEQRDENALATLYDRYSSIIYSLLMRMLKSVDDAEEIMQELFTNIFTNPKVYQTSSGLSLQNIIAEGRKRSINRIHSRGTIKQSTHHESVILPLFSESASLNVIDGIPEHLSPAKILSILKNLDKDEQNILSLAYYDGLTLTEISLRLNLPASTISWAMRKSLMTMRGSILNDKSDPSTHETKFLEYCAMRALDLPEVREAEDFNNHLKKGCEICNNEIIKNKEIISYLPLGLPHLTLSPELKQRVMFAVRLSEVVKVNKEEKQENIKLTTKPEIAVEKKQYKPTRKFWIVFSIIVTLCICLIASILYIIKLHEILDKHTPTYEQSLFIERLSEMVERKNDVLNILSSTNLKIIPFQPYQSQLPGKGKLFYNPDDTIAVLQTSQLPTIPDNQEYNLWALVNGTYISCGTFNVKSQLQPENFYIINMPKSVKSGGETELLITLEKKGGAETPTGKRYLVGTIKLEN